MKLSLTAPLAVFAAISISCAAQGSGSASHGIPFEMPRVVTPSIPARNVSIVDFGGVGDGTTLNTEAFAAAMQALVRKGGGRLTVPAGIWFSGPITLESNTELHLEKNAVLLFSTDQNLYPIIDTNFEGLDVRRCLSPINALGAHDIAITGEGIIDGNGDAWREVKRRKVSDDQWKLIKARGGFIPEDGKGWYPDEGYYKARLTAGSLNYPDPSLDEQEIKTFLRPVLVSLRECERVLLEGCTFQNSPCWNIHPLYCKNLTVNNITVRNPHYSANGDGIDIDACENVVLTGSSFDVGDDAICIKSGKDADGRRHARACKNLIIKDCTVYHGHGGFVVGSEMSGGVENILVDGCCFIGTDVGLRFKSTRGRGGEVKNIWCRNIYMKDIVAEAVTFNLYYAGVSATEKAPADDNGVPNIGPNDPSNGSGVSNVGHSDPSNGSGVSNVGHSGPSNGSGVSNVPNSGTIEAKSAQNVSNVTNFGTVGAVPEIDETTPVFHSFYFDNLVCAGAKKAIYINGLPELPLRDISFSNCVFTAKKGAEVQNCEDISVKNLIINGKEISRLRSK